MKIAANDGFLVACDPFVIAYRVGVTQVVAQPNNLPNAHQPARRRESRPVGPANRDVKRRGTWLHRPILASDDEKPIELIARGKDRRVAKLIAEIEYAGVS
jgi:hypothetical protein